MIKYISQPCGAGKGEHIKNEVQNGKGQKFIIVQETKQLLEQTYRDIQRFSNGEPVKKKIIISGTGRGNLLQEIIESLPSADVLFITDKMFHQIPVEKLTNHRIFIDDCPASFDIMCRSISKDEREHWMKLYEKMFILKDEYQPGYTNFELSNTSDTSDDTREIRNKFKGFNMFHNRVICDDVFNGGNVLSVIGWYDYKKYVGLDMTVLMNQFEESIIYKMSPEVFTPEKNFTPIPSFNETNMERLTVKYFSKGEGRNGLTARKLYGEEMATVNQALRDILGGDYIWTSNKNSTLSLPGIKVAANQRGINTYRDMDTFVFMFASNPNPQAIRHMEDLFGITADDFMKEKELELMNQFGFRTALRKYDDTPVIGYVYDIEQARYFERLGATIEFVDIGLQKRKNPKQSNIPSKLRGKFRTWKSKAKGDYSGFEKWATKQILDGALPEWIESFRNSLTN